MKRFSIASLQVDVEKKVIYEGQKVVPVPPKAVEVLIVLLENAGRVVSRDEIRDQVWGQTYVDEANLTRSIGMLRNVLRSYFGNVDPIKTYPKRGYQFREPVATVDPEVPATPAHAAEGAPIESSLILPNAGDPTSEDDISPGSAATGPHPRSWWGKVRLRISTPLLACLALVIAGAVYLDATSHQRMQRPSIAILNLRNLSGDSKKEWLGEGLRETLMSGVAFGGHTRLVRPARVTQAEMDLHLTATRDYDNGAIQALGKLLACRYVITGSYLAVADEVRFDLALRDAKSGDVVTSFSGDTAFSNLAPSMEDAVSKIRKVLGQGSAPASNVQLIGDTEQSASGFADYLEGVHAFEVGNLDLARTLLSRAVDAHPSFPLAHSVLASTWQQMGYSDQASKEARLAIATASSLPRDQRIEVQANASLIATDWPPAIEAYSGLAKRFPDDIDFQLDLAECFVRAGNPKQSLRTLQALLNNSKEAQSDPRVPMQQAAAAAAMGDWRGELLYSGQQIREARMRGSSFLLSRGLMSEGTAWMRLGDRQRAIADYGQAETIAERSDDQVEQATVLTAWGAEKGLRKDPEAASTLEKAVSLYKDTGALTGEVNALAELGCAYTYTEDWNAAKAAFHDSINIANQLHSPGLGIGALMDLIYVALNEDDLRSAERYSNDGLSLARQINNLDAISTIDLDLGDISYARGHVAEAKKYYQQSLDVVQQIDGGYAIAKILSHMEVLEIGAGRLQAARRLNDQATGMHVLTGERLEYQQVAEGALLIDEGQVNEAKRAMTALAEGSTTAHPGAEAWRLVALCNLKQGDLDGAQSAIQKALAFARGSRNTRTYLIPDSVVADRIAAERGRTAPALADLKRQLQSAKRIGDVPLQLSIQLAEGEIELRHGQFADGKRTLLNVEHQAAQDGLGLTIAKAQAAATHPMIALKRASFN